MRFLSISMVLLCLTISPGAARADERPIDPYLCLVPVPFGETGSSRAAGVHPDPGSVQFVPGYPTPIFYTVGRPGALYIDPAGHLRPHPRPAPSDFARFYLGPDGTIFSILLNLSASAMFFDRDRGYMRPMGEASSAQRAELERLRTSLDEPKLGARKVRPLDRSHAGGSVRRQGGKGGEPWLFEATSLGVRVEGGAGWLRLSNNGQSVDRLLPGLTPYWSLTELPRSGRAVLTSRFDRRLLIVDKDLNLTRPAGEWRSPRHPELIVLPETGEALVTSSNALFWLRDRRISSPGICDDTDPPPLAPVRLVVSPGTEEMIQDERDRVRGFWPDARDGTVLLHSERGLFRLWPDGVVRRLVGLPRGIFRSSYPIPGTEQVLVNAPESFVIVDGNHVVFRSGRIGPCCQDLAPMLRNPKTGSILLSDGRYLTRDWKIRELQVPGVDLRLFSGRPAVSSAAWLPGPLIGGFIWDEKDELQLLGIESAPPLDRRGRVRAVTGAEFWLDFRRFGFLATETKGWRKVGPDLRLVPMPGQPEGYGDAIVKYYGPVPFRLFDPGSGDMLLGMPEGLWGVDASGGMRRIGCANGCAYGGVLSIAAAPGGGGAAIVGTEGGLFGYDPGAGGALVRVAPVGLTGRVYRLHDLPWRKALLVEAAFGNFVWDSVGGLRRLEIDAGRGSTAGFAVAEGPRRNFIRGAAFGLLEFTNDD